MLATLVAIIITVTSAHSEGKAIIISYGHISFSVATITQRICDVV